MTLLELTKQTTSDGEQYDLVAFTPELLDDGLIPIITSANNKQNFPHLSTEQVNFKANYDNMLKAYKELEARKGQLNVQEQEEYNKLVNFIFKNAKQRFQIQSAITFSQQLEFLFSIPAYWDYLKFKALLEEHHQTIQAEKIRLSNLEKDLKQNKFGYDKAETKRKFNELHHKQEILEKVTARFEKTKKDFTDQENSFLAQIKEAKKTKALTTDLRFNISNRTLQFLTAAIATDNPLVSTEKISEIQSKFNKFNKFNSNSIPKKWEQQKEYARYNSKELLILKEDYLNSTKNWINGAKEELRKNTKPKGFIENVQYFFNRFLFVKKIPPKVVEEKEKLLDAYQAAHDQEDLAILEAMLVKLENADKNGDIYNDDTMWQFNSELAELNCAPFQTLSPNATKLEGLNIEDEQISMENATKRMNDNASKAGSIITLEPNKHLTPDIAAKFQAYINKFISENSLNEYRAAVGEDKETQKAVNKQLAANYKFAQNFKDRLNNLKMSTKPADWKFVVKGDLEQKLANNPAIWLAINMLEGKFTKGSIAESAAILGTPAGLLGSIDKDGNLTSLQQKESLMMAAIAQFALIKEEAKKASSRANPQLMKMLAYVDNKLTDIQKKLDSNKSIFVGMIKDAAQEAITKAINMQSIYAEEGQRAILLRQLAMQLANANAFIAQEAGTAEKISIFPDLIKYPHENWLDIPEVYDNIHLLISTFGNDKQQLAFTVISKIIAGKLVPITQKDYDKLELVLSALFEHITNETKKKDEVKNLLKSLTEKYVYPQIITAALKNKDYFDYPSKNKTQIISDQIKFLNTYSPEQLYSLKVELSKKIKDDNYDVRNPRYHLAYALIAKEKDFHKYCIKRFTYLIEHRKEQSGILYESDRWLFAQVRNNKYVTNEMLKVLQAAINQTSDHKLNTVGENDEELLKLALMFGNTDIAFDLHKKIARNIHSIINDLTQNDKANSDIYKSKRELTKTLIQHYTKALKKHSDANLPYELKQELQEKAKDYCKELYNEHKKPSDKFDQGHLPFYQALADIGFCSEEVLQDFKTDCLLEQISNGYIKPEFAGNTYLFMLKLEFGEGNIKRIYEELKRVVTPDKKYEDIGKDIIPWCAELLADPDFAEAVYPDNSLYKAVTEIINRDRVANISNVLVEHILNLLYKKQFEAAASLYKAIKDKNYESAIAALPINMRDIVIPKWEDTSERQRIIDSLININSKNNNIIYDTVQPMLEPQFTEFVKRQFSHENIDNSTRQIGVEQLETAKGTFVAAKLISSKQQDHDINSKQTIDDLINLIKMFDDTDLTSEAENIINKISGHYKKIYDDFLQALSASAEVAGSDFKKLYGFILNSNTVNLIRDMLSADDKFEIANKIENKMRRLEELLTNTIENEVANLGHINAPLSEEMSKNLEAWQNFNKGHYKDPFTYALKAASNLILKDNDKQETQDRELLAAFPSFYNLFSVIDEILDNPENHLDTDLVLFHDEDLSEARNFINSRNPCSPHYQAYIERQINLLIDKKLAPLALPLIKTFGTPEQNKAAAEQKLKMQQHQLEHAISRISRFVNLFQEFKAHEVLTRKLTIEKDANFIMRHGTETQQSWLKLRLERLAYLFLDINANYPDAKDKTNINKYIIPLVTYAYKKAFGEEAFNKEIASYLVEDKTQSFYQEKWGILPKEDVDKYLNERDFRAYTNSFDDKAFNYLRGKIDKNIDRAKERINILYSIRDKFIKYGIYDDASLENILSGADKHTFFKSEELHELGVSNSTYTYNQKGFFDQSAQFQRKVKTVLLISANIHRAYHLVRDIDASEIAIARQKEMIKECTDLQKKHYKKDEASEFYNLLFKNEEKDTIGKQEADTFDNAWLYQRHF